MIDCGKSAGLQIFHSASDKLSVAVIYSTSLFSDSASSFWERRRSLKQIKKWQQLWSATDENKLIVYQWGRDQYELSLRFDLKSFIFLCSVVKKFSIHMGHMLSRRPSDRRFRCHFLRMQNGRRSTTSRLISFMKFFCDAVVLNPDQKQFFRL